MVQFDNIPDGEDSVSKFRRPLILLSSQKKWGAMILLCGSFTAIGIAQTIYAASFGSVSVIVFFGFGTIVSVTAILPGGNSLRLDGNGFEITRFFFVRQKYSWRNVSDFAVWAMFGPGLVAFRARKPHINCYERINAAIAGGRNGLLPDTYGMTAGDLVQLMIRWRNSAMNANK